MVRAARRATRASRAFRFTKKRERGKETGRRGERGGGRVARRRYRRTVRYVQSAWTARRGGRRRARAQLRPLRTSDATSLSLPGGAARDSCLPHSIVVVRAWRARGPVHSARDMVASGVLCGSRP